MAACRPGAWGGILVASALTGCMTTKIPTLIPLPEPEAPVASATAAEGAPAPVSINQDQVNEDVAELLADAEAALASDRLTSPIHDNAFDRFQAVLMLQPNNARALSGLQRILLRYIALAKNAAARGEYGKARALLERARWVDRDNAEIDRFAQEMAAAAAAQQKNHSGATADNEYPLAKEQLDSQKDDVIDHLQDIARQARESGSSLLIVARSDSEGRWIYQQMKQAVPGFLLRGDIKLGRQPKILLLPSID